MTGLLYKIEQSEEYTSTLVDTLTRTVLDWTSQQPDVFLVSGDGCKIFTHKILLMFYSEAMRHILEDKPSSEISGISVPFPTNSVFLLLKLLISGSVDSDSKRDLTFVTQLAEYLGINLDNTEVIDSNKFGDKENNPKCTRKVKSQRKELKAVKEEIVVQDEPVVNESELVLMEQNSLDVTGEIVGIDQSENLMDEIENVEEGIEDQIENVVYQSEDVIKIEKKDFVCKECGKSFTNSSILKNHSKTHTGERPYSCSECDKAFSQSGNLKMHKLVHTGELPFQCNQCEKGFRQAGNLRTHVKRYHGQD